MNPKEIQEYYILKLEVLNQYATAIWADYISYE